MYEKSLIQQYSELLESKQKLNKTLEEYIEKYDIHNLYLDSRGNKVAPVKMKNESFTVSEEYDSVEEVVHNTNPNNIIYIYKNNEDEYRFRLLTSDK